uniref:Uncharacterized protein n=1 Tax=Glossina pallidipes TaxID=7398 RepID=A0A1A9ZTI4_GLOPL
MEFPFNTDCIDCIRHNLSLVKPTADIIYSRDNNVQRMELTADKCQSKYNSQQIKTTAYIMLSYQPKHRKERKKKLKTKLLVINFNDSTYWTLVEIEIDRINYKRSEDAERITELKGFRAILQQNNEGVSQPILSAKVNGNAAADVIAVVADGVVGVVDVIIGVVAVDIVNSLAGLRFTIVVLITVVVSGDEGVVG